MERITLPCETRKTDDVIYRISPADTLLADDEVQDYIDLLNGISKFCSGEGYNEGYRNEIIVNLTVGTYMLGLDPDDVLTDFNTTDLIDCSDDDEDPYTRMERVLGYTRRFCWDWMIEADWWRNFGAAAREDSTCYLPVRFELED